MKQLVQSGQFYYHNRLRLMPEPPVSYIDNDGVIYKLEQESTWFMEMVTSFTIVDLLKYYCTSFNFKPRSKHDAKFMIGGLNYLVDMHGLDVTLFTIDAASSHYMEMSSPPNPTNVVKCLQEFVPLGYEHLESKKTREHSEGTDCVIPRSKSVQNSRSWSKSASAVQL